MERNGEKNAIDESLRRLGGIFASPSLVMSYEHTTPLAERRYLARLGLTRAEADEFAARMCEHGALDGGARALIERLCRARAIDPAAAARLMLRGEGWPEEGDT